MTETLTKQINWAVKFQRKIYLGLATLIEYVNKYILKLENLEGYSNSVYEEIELYDEVFKLNYIRYKDW